MERIVLPELLDVLPPQDHSALRSRRDLRRLNAWMGHPRIMARLLKDHLPDPDARHLVELGAGDGHFLLSVARHLQGPWPRAQATLVDRLDVLDPKTTGQFNRLGWKVRAEIAEASDWLRQSSPNAVDAVMANLFLHQFQTEQLAELLQLAANSSRLVIALEPRRLGLSRFCVPLMWLLGCGPVTRHDGRISVRAGFAGSELSSLWPEKQNWDLVERRVGLFSHLFIARRKD